MRVKKWLGNKYNIHYLVYLLGVFVFYLVNFFRVNGSGAQWGFFNELIGVVVFAMVMIRFNNHRSVLLPYTLVTVLFALVFYPIFKHYAPGTDYNWQLVGRYVNIYLGVLTVIRVFFFLFKEDKEKRTGKGLTVCFWVWVGLLFFCLISKNSSIWPLWALLVLTSFYIVPLEVEEKKSMLAGFVDGIILCFFVYQGLALLHRPYEKVWVRYSSFFSNSDCSAKFFTISYVGFLIKYIILKYENRPRVWRILAFLFSGAMWGFLFFTMTRSGFIGMGFTTMVFLVIEHYGFAEGLGKLVKQSLALVGVAIISVPIVYLSIRYIPAFRHHPIFIGMYAESRVHSYDPIDSWKYAKWSDVVDAYLGRARETVESSDVLVMADAEIAQMKAEENSEAKSTAESEKKPIPIMLSKNGERVIEYSDGVNPGTDADHPKYVSFSYNNLFERSLGIRKYLYSAYFLDSGWLGNRDEYPSEYVGNNEMYTSSHNSTLDFMVRYGYISGGIFLLFQIAIILYGLKAIKKSGRNVDLSVVFATLVASSYFAWGLFYSVSFVGEIMDTMFWVSAIFVMKNNIEDNLTSCEGGNIKWTKVRKAE